MSAKVSSRAFARGRVKRLRRMRQPLALNVLMSIEPRNAVARALAQRAVSSAAGKHVRARGATRRAEKMQLGKMVREMAGAGND